MVQFIHPGGEHPPVHGTRRKEWNRGVHRRKFMVTGGTFLREGHPNEREIAFWGEWEPESDVLEEFDPPVNGKPRFVHRPHYVVPRSYAGLQNTDPFVLGGFLYGICQQHARGRPTRMQYLAHGSVILFGSHVDGAFVLDTVFVVRDGIGHTSDADLDAVRERIPHVYEDVVLKVLYANNHFAGHGPATIRQLRAMLSGRE